jgi:predicted Zn-dependent peptidase
MKNVRSVWAEVRTKGGAWHEDKKKLGITHFIEHLSLLETEKWPTLKKLNDFIDTNALFYNAYTSGMGLRYWFEIPDVFLDQGVELMEQIFFHPLFLEKRLANELSVIKQEHREYWDNPYNRFYNLRLEQLFGKGHQYCRHTLGVPKKLEEIKRQELLNLYRLYMQPQNMVFSFVGNVDSDEVRKKMEITLKKKENKTKIKLKEGKIAPQGKKIIHRDVIQQPKIVINWHIPSMLKLNLKKTLTVDIVKSILAGWSTSLLFERLRDELGLVYGVDANIYNYPEISIFEISCRTREEAIEDVIAEVKKVMEKYLEDGISQARFGQIKKVKDLSTAMYYDHGDNICKRIASNVYNDDPPRTPEDYIEAMRKITESYARDYLSDYLNWDKAYISMMVKK